MSDIREGSHIAAGEVYKLREDGKCMVVHCQHDMGCKARIRLKQENGSWMTVGYFPDLIQAMQVYHTQYAHVGKE